jgi:hypothetical protein
VKRYGPLVGFGPEEKEMGGWAKRLRPGWLPLHDRKEKKTAVLFISFEFRREGENELKTKLEMVLKIFEIQNSLNLFENS